MRVCLPPDLLASPVEVLPSLPVLGEQIIVRYNSSAEGSLLKGVSDLKGEVLLMREDDLPLFMEVPMRRSEGLWQGAFSISDSGARVLLLKFRSRDQLDDNGGRVWNMLVHDQEGRELRGARARRSEMYRSGGFGEFKHEKDHAAAKPDLEKEIAHYPEEYPAVGQLWRLQLQETADEKTNSDVVAAAPHGEVARSVRMRDIFRDEDPRNRALRFDEFLRIFPPAPRAIESQQVTLARLYLRAGQTVKADSVLGAMEGLNVNLLNSTARRLSENGSDIERAETLSRRALEALRSPVVTPKPSYMSPAAREKSRRSTLAIVLDTYATALSGLGKHTEAEKVYEEAFGLSGGSAPDLTERLLRSYLRNGKAAKARDLARQAVRAGNSHENIVGVYRKAFVAVTGSGTGFASELESAKAVAGAEMRNRLRRERLGTPAPDFALPFLEGSTVRLSDLRGKVVVVDFWVPWCGSCRMSFPHLQAVYEAYRTNDRVMILAVNTWEPVTGERRADLVRGFMRDNGYSFPVLFDAGTVDRYRVEGIPTKFVIDPAGRIAFKSIGFTGGQKLEDKLTAQIEMLLLDSPV